MTTLDEWAFDPYGHAWRRVSAYDVERAKLEREARQAEHGDAIFLVRRDTRWIGQLGENEAAAFLRAHGRTVVQHGGVDKLPDLEVDGAAVAVKTMRVGAHVPTDDWLFPIAERYGTRPNGDYLLCCACNPDGPDVAVLGIISHRRFMQKARHVAAGGSPRPGLTVSYPSFWLPVGALVSALDWSREARQAKEALRA